MDGVGRLQFDFHTDRYRLADDQRDCEPPSAPAKRRHRRCGAAGLD
jgi:hypothetical protein